MTWSYADPSWWKYAILSNLPKPLHSEPPPAYVDACDGVATGESYEQTLAWLARRGSECTTTQCKHALARVKLMRKWRLAPANLAAVRSAIALGGFIDRNNVAAQLDGEGIPEFLVPEIKRLLSYWLPEVGDDRWTGRFGPGACAEGWTHGQRFTALSRWYASTPDFGLDCLIGYADVDRTCARLQAVPKQFDKDRLITVEPAYASFCQQAVRSMLLESIHAGPLRGTAMDLDHTDGPAIQRRLALRASLNGKYATIDLKDASDNITWDIVTRVFPLWVVRLLEQSRSSSFECDYINPDSGVKCHLHQPLAIFAGMGNATTFVVETLFFSAYVVAWAEFNRLPAFVSTFGDDIICDSSTARSLIQCGQCPCFRINATKSFWGVMSLRESCGIFAVSGRDITVPRIDGYPEDWAGKCGLASVTSALARDPAFTGLVSEIVTRHGLPNYPMYVSGYPSFSVDTVQYDEMPKTRWNPALQCREVQVECEVPVLTSMPTSCGSAVSGHNSFETFQNRDPKSWLTSPFVALYTRDPALAGYYLGSLLGQIQVETRGKQHVVLMPVGSTRRKLTWRRLTPVCDWCPSLEGSDASSALCVSLDYVRGLETTPIQWVAMFNKSPYIKALLRDSLGGSEGADL